VYEKNYGIRPDGDISLVAAKDVPAHDILCGGFPCQPFSKAGQQRGFDDDRGNLFFKICEIVKHHKPKYLLLENVRNLGSHDGGNTWRVIRENIRTLGYLTADEPIILNALHFDVPQNRERVMILCKREDLGPLPEFTPMEKNPKNSLRTHVSALIDESGVDAETLPPKMVVTEKVWDAFVRTLRKKGVVIPKFPIWTDWWDNAFEETDPFYVRYKNWIDKNRNFYKEHGDVLTPWLEKARGEPLWKGAVRKFEWQAGDERGLDEVLWTPRSSGVRCKRVDYVPTLVALNTCPIYGPLRRRLTPRELLRLQSFPDSFEYEKKSIFKQVGNAVNVRMILFCVDYLI
jgi:DNA (cytosine-5)-methyltransferase 1